MSNNSKYPANTKQAMMINEKSKACQSARIHMGDCADDAIIYLAGIVIQSLADRGENIPESQSEELVMKLALFMADKPQPCPDCGCMVDPPQIFCYRCERRAIPRNYAGRRNPRGSLIAHGLEEYE